MLNNNTTKLYIIFNSKTKYTPLKELRKAAQLYSAENEKIIPIMELIEFLEQLPDYFCSDFVQTCSIQEIRKINLGVENVNRKNYFR